MKFYVDGRFFWSFNATSEAEAKRIFDQRFRKHEILYTEEEDGSFRTLVLRQSQPATTERKSEP